MERPEGETLPGGEDRTVSVRVVKVRVREWRGRSSRMGESTREEMSVSESQGRRAGELTKVALTSSREKTGRRGGVVRTTAMSDDGPGRGRADVVAMM